MGLVRRSGQNSPISSREICRIYLEREVYVVGMDIPTWEPRPLLEGVLSPAG